MDWSQIRERCPSARFLGVAILLDHRLAFSRFSSSSTRKCGVADVVESEGSEVWGVVYDIDERDIGNLDKKEGFQLGRKNNSYQREQRQVFLDGSLEKPLAVEIYFATPQPGTHLPSQKYKDLILSSAKYWHLPEGYIRDVLEPIQVKEE
jgi:gamma-glutamylcyclotransferase